MAGFNKKVSSATAVARKPEATKNHAGGLAFKMNDEIRLYTMATTGFFEDKYYEKASAEHQKLKEAVAACDREFVLKLANFARNRMHLRTKPIMLLAEAARERYKGEPKAILRKYVPKIIRRADEPGELIAYWLQNVGPKGTLPNSIKQGLSDALLQFDEYQLAKYAQRGDVRLRDVIQIVHAKPDTEERSGWYRALLDETMKPAKTWEVEISTKGSTTENWDEIAPHMGIMALLRNLRNFEKVGAKKAMQIAIQTFQDPEAVKKSKQLPFRWYSAYKHVTDRKVKDALNKALNLSLACIEPWDGVTAIVTDNSGSMHSAVSWKSEVTLIEIASILGAMALALSPDEYYVGAFGDRFDWVDVSKLDSVLTNMERIQHMNVGHSTNAWTSVNRMIKDRVKVDRLLLFSDMQCYDSVSKSFRGPWYSDGRSLAAEWRNYRASVNPNAVLYSIDLNAYGTSQFPIHEPGVVMISGWSDAVLDYIRYTEGAEAMVEEIKRNW